MAEVKNFYLKKADNGLVWIAYRMEGPMNCMPTPADRVRQKQGEDLANKYPNRVSSGDTFFGYFNGIEKLAWNGYNAFATIEEVETELLRLLALS